MPRSEMRLGSCLLLALATAGCTGELTSVGPGSDSGTVVPGIDSGTVVPGIDSGTVVPGIDSGTPPVGTDTGPPRVDAGPPRFDAGPIDPDTCPYTVPLATPVAGCSPAVLPSTGDPHVDCWRRINQFRCECQHLPPLDRWIAGEACADQMAAYDHDRPTMAHAGFQAGICAGGYGQNECPGWGSVPQTISGCLQQMWDEGPGDFYGPPPHGHYLNMSSTSFGGVACGFFTGANGTFAVQNFH